MTFKFITIYIILLFFFFLIILRPPISTLFPYTTLFRSDQIVRRSMSQSPSFHSSVPRQLDRELRSEEHTSELQSHRDIVCRLLLEKKKKTHDHNTSIPLQIKYNAQNISKTKK